MYTIYQHIFPNNKVYIGATKSKLYKRFGKDGKNYRSKEMQEDIKKYGWNNIQHKIIETNLSYAQAIEKEKFYIAKFNACNPEFGYNKEIGGGFAEIVNQKPYSLTEKRKEWFAKLKEMPIPKERIEKSRQSHLKRLNRYVLQIKNGIVIKKWDSICDINRELGFDKSFLGKTCKYNETHEKKRSAYGYIWIYKKRDC